MSRGLAIGDKSEEYEVEFWQLVMEKFLVDPNRDTIINKMLDEYGREDLSEEDIAGIFNDPKILLDDYEMWDYFYDVAIDQIAIIDRRTIWIYGVVMLAYENTNGYLGEESTARLISALRDSKFKVYEFKMTSIPPGSSAFKTTEQTIYTIDLDVTMIDMGGRYESDYRIPCTTVMELADGTLFQKIIVPKDTDGILSYLLVEKKGGEKNG